MNKVKHGFITVWLVLFIPFQIFSQESNLIISTEEFQTIVNANLARNRGNEFTIRGTVVRARSDPSWVTGSFVPCVYLRYNFWNDIVFEFPQNRLDSIKNIEPDDIVTIKGRVENATRLTDSIIISIEKKNPPFSIKPFYSAEEVSALLYNRPFLIDDGKRFRFTGTISRIDGRNGEYLLTFGGLNFFQPLNCIFTSQHREKVLNINVGDRVTIEGAFSLRREPLHLLLGGYKFFDCIIIE